VAVLPDLGLLEQLALEHTVMGLSTGPHIMTLYRDWLAERGVLTSAEFRRCKARQKVTVAGQIVVHQAPPTAKGVHFLTLEDETGVVDVVVRPEAYRQYRPIIRNSPLIMVQGVVQRSSGAVSLLGKRVSEVWFDKERQD